MNIELLTSEQIKDLRISGKILAAAMSETISYVKEGIATKSLDEIAERSLRKNGATPSFKNYRVGSAGRYPASLCISINEELVHGIPKGDKILKNGDIVSLDLGANYNGMFSDMAVTIGVGKINKSDKDLIQVTKQTLDHAISKLFPGIKSGDLGNYIESYVNSHGYVVVHDLVGHGIGTAPHTDPQIPNFGKKNTGVEIVNNMAIAIEPMVSTIDNSVETARDNWTIKMSKGQRSAHFEHTVLLLDNKVEVVTKI